jgi:hypothetical protein
MDTITGFRSQDLMRATFLGWKHVKHTFFH